MEIRDITITEQPDYNELSGYCGDFRLWYRFPRELELTISADPFVAASFIPSMVAGEDITIPQDYPLSVQLRKNLAVIRKVFLLWNRHYRENHKVEFHHIDVIGGRDAVPHGNDQTVSFFSGGVDGLDTFLRQADNIDSLIFVHGIDMQLENQSCKEAIAANRSFLSAYGKPLLTVTTNVRFLGHHYGAKWQSCCAGGGLASIALAGGFRTCYIASSDPHREVRPDGTNYVTDPMWSNGHTRLIYEGGEYLRIEKLQNIAREAPAALDILRVCWQDKGYNCGSCDKCLRTMLSLQLLGLSARTLPALTRDDLKKIRASRFYKDGDLLFFKENLELARQLGNQEMINILLPPIRRYRIRKLVKDLLKLIKGDIP